jgi:hypothetical protein
MKVNDYNASWVSAELPVPPPFTAEAGLADSEDNNLAQFSVPPETAFSLVTLETSSLVIRYMPTNIATKKTNRTK